MGAPAMISVDALNAFSHQFWARGVRVLQGARLAPTDDGHVRALLDEMRPTFGAVIADIGCGFGEVARKMREFRPDLDFRLINNNAVQLGYAPVVFQRIECDMHAIPIPFASVDGAMFCYSLCHADQPVALREAARITRRGGFLFVYDYERVSGTNDLMNERLGARSFPFEQTIAEAESAGWGDPVCRRLDADDTLFRDAYADDAGYDEIFRHLQLVAWRMTRQ